MLQINNFSAEEKKKHHRSAVGAATSFQRDQIQKVVHHYGDTAADLWGSFILLYIFGSRRNKNERPWLTKNKTKQPTGSWLLPPTGGMREAIHQ